MRAQIPGSSLEGSGEKVVLLYYPTGRDRLERAACLEMQLTL